MENKFLSAVNNVGYTENGAVTNKSTLDVLMDQFGVAGSYRGREIKEVFDDQEALYNYDARKSLIFPFYLRAITRKTKDLDGKTTPTPVKGQGAKDEAFKRLLWFAKNHPQTFVENIALLPIVGCWKDLITLCYYDSEYKVNAINHDFILDLISIGLRYDEHSALIKKYLPRICSNKKCTTTWTMFKNNFGKALANKLKLTYAEYNKLKATGTAHDFQKLISTKEFDKINWNHIPGKAMLILTSGKFLANQNLEDNFMEWMKGRTDIHFNGYAYELGKDLPMDLYGARNMNTKTIANAVRDLQFNSLLKTGKECGSINGNVWCALDTSGSMTSCVSGSKSITAFQVCISLGIYFSALNTGAFKDNVVMFDDVSESLQLKGTFTEKWKQIVNRNTAWGSTNFQSVIDLLVRTRNENKNIPLEEFPTTLLVVSDMEFNESYSNHGYSTTNHTVAKEKLYEVFPEEYVNNLKFVWWNVCPRNPQNYAATKNDDNNYFFSGFDGAIITELLGGSAPQEQKTITMEEVIENALSQEIFSTLTLVD